MRYSRVQRKIFVFYKNKKLFPWINESWKLEKLLFTCVINFYKKLKCINVQTNNILFLYRIVSTKQKREKRIFPYDQQLIEYGSDDDQC
jgi:hypothetical protein